MSEQFSRFKYFDEYHELFKQFRDIEEIIENSPDQKTVFAAYHDEWLSLADRLTKARSLATDIEKYGLQYPPLMGPNASGTPNRQVDKGTFILLFGHDSPLAQRLTRKLAGHSAL